MRKRLSMVALAAVAALALTSAPASAADKDCSDFSTWRQAQNFYKKHGGPRPRVCSCTPIWDTRADAWLESLR